VDWTGCSNSIRTPGRWLGAVLGSGLTGEKLKAATAGLRRGGLASLPWRLQFCAAATPSRPRKARRKNSRGRALRLLRIVRAGVVARDAGGFLHPELLFNWTGGFLGTATTAGAWHSGQLDHAGDERRPDAESGHVPAGSGAQAAGLARDHARGILARPRGSRVCLVSASAALIIAVQILHGVCYAFFFAAVYIFADAYFPKTRGERARLFNVMVLASALLANSICPLLGQHVFLRDGVTDFHALFMCHVLRLAAAVALAVCFHPPKVPAGKDIEARKRREYGSGNRQQLWPTIPTPMR